MKKIVIATFMISILCIKIHILCLSELDKKLFEAVETDDLQQTQSLLENGANANAKDLLGDTPFWWALKNNSQDIIKFLIEKGKADLSLKDQSGHTPLFWILMNNNFELVKFLIENKKIDLNAKDKLDTTLLLWTLYLRQFGLAQLLVEKHNIDVNVKDKFGNTPLLWALYLNQIDLAKLFIEKGKADVNVKDQFGDNPFWWTLKNSNFDLVKFFVTTGKADVNYKDKLGNTPFWWALKNKHFNLAKFFVENGKVDFKIKDQLGNTPFWWTLKKKYFDLAIFFVQKGNIDIDTTDEKGQTPLYILLGMYHTMKKEKIKKIAQLLIEHGANIYHKENSGDTPINRAQRIDIAKNTNLIKSMANAYSKKLLKDTNNQNPKIGKIYEYQCPICFKKGTDTILSCGHTIHQKHILEMFQTGMFYCPLCKQPIITIEKRDFKKFPDPETQETNPEISKNKLSPLEILMMRKFTTTYEVKNDKKVHDTLKNIVLAIRQTPPLTDTKIGERYFGKTTFQKLKEKITKRPKDRDPDKDYEPQKEKNQYNNKKTSKEKSE